MKLAAVSRQTILGTLPLPQHYGAHKADTDSLFTRPLSAPSLGCKQILITDPGVPATSPPPESGLLVIFPMVSA